MQTYQNLKTILMFDAAFSEHLAQVMGTLGGEVYFIVGAVLAVWSVELGSMVISVSLRRRFAKWTIVADWSWVVATLIIMAGFTQDWTLVGNTILLVSALLVAGVAISKQLALKKDLSASSDDGETSTDPNAENQVHGVL